MSERRLRLLAPGGYIVGIACLVVGFVLQFNVSEGLGWDLIGVGGLLTGGTRLVARWRGLPAP